MSHILQARFQETRRFFIWSIVGVSVALISPTAIAQKKSKEPPKKTPKQAQSQQQKSAPKLKMPDAFKLNMLIRTSILSLNDANRSGNYTVLRDLSAPGFQAANSSAKLAVIFSKLRARNLDLSPVILFNPKLVRQPAFTKSGLLRLTGFIPTKPEQVNFDLAFQFIRNRWRIFAISVNTSPTKVVATNPDDGKKNNKNKKSKTAKEKTKVETKSKPNVVVIDRPLDAPLLPVRRPNPPKTPKAVENAEPKKKKSNSFWPFNN